MRRGYFTPPVLIGLALLCFFVAATLFINSSLLKNLKNQPIPSPSASPVPADETVYPEASRSANWGTYANSHYGYSIKYPPDVPINEDRYGVWLDKQIWIQVSVAPEIPCRGDCEVDESIEDLKIGGINAKKILGYRGSMDGIPQRYQRVEILHNGYLYSIWLYALKFDNDLPFEDQEIKEIPKEEIKLFNQILSTFKFIN